MTKEQFIEITEWQKRTFGQATTSSKLAHLAEELTELYEAVHADKSSDENAKDKRLEFADCFLLLFGAAGADGMSYEDIVDCIDEKMVINYSRKWGTPNELGVVNHIPDTE